MPNLGPTELLIILAIVIVLFGATRVADIGKGVGRGIREFRKEIKDESADDKDAADAKDSADKEESKT